MLAACGSTTVIEHQVINYVFEPEVYQHCSDAPEPPAEGATVGDWVEGYEAERNAGQDCRDKVNGGREWQLQKRRQIEGPDQPEPALWDRLIDNEATPKKNPD